MDHVQRRLLPPGDRSSAAASCVRSKPRLAASRKIAAIVRVLSVVTRSPRRVSGSSGDWWKRPRPDRSSAFCRDARQRLDWNTVRSAQSRSAWSSTFAASLELARQGDVVLEQDAAFELIHMSPSSDRSSDHRTFISCLITRSGLEFHCFCLAAFQDRIFKPRVLEFLGKRLIILCERNQLPDRLPVVRMMLSQIAVVHCL
jgi:hypothetical protein